ncbi:MAG: hypothetical protein BMS9Abin07_0434 [Acidimicrobiia bacterium]|nr:MAG: hypothetical protein BMS9Abin07_0434 [Acidimicrobiia bacterium]
MITYEIPLERYPETYNGKPLQYAALAAQKHYNALYLTSVAFTGGEEAFRERYERSGRHLDMGKSCLRYNSAEDVALDIIGETIAAGPIDAYLSAYEEARGIS